MLLLLGPGVAEGVPPYSVLCTYMCVLLCIHTKSDAATEAGRFVRQLRRSLLCCVGVRSLEALIDICSVIWRPKG